MVGELQSKLENVIAEQLAEKEKVLLLPLHYGSLVNEITGLIIIVSGCERGATPYC